MLNKLRNKCLSKVLGSKTKQDSKMEIRQRLDLKCKISQGSRGNFPTKAIQSIQRSTKLKGLHLSLKKIAVVDLMWRGLFVLSVVVNMKANVKSEGLIA